MKSVYMKSDSILSGIPENAKGGEQKKDWRLPEVGECGKGATESFLQVLGHFCMGSEWWVHDSRGASELRVTNSEFHCVPIF